MDQDPLATERRRFQRVLFDAPTRLIATDKSFETRLVDVSLKGALTAKPTGCQFSSGIPVEIRISLADAATEICMQAHVAHTEADVIGFCCDKIDMESITHLRRLVELNLGDSSLLERDLRHLG